MALGAFFVSGDEERASAKRTARGSPLAPLFSRLPHPDTLGAPRVETTHYYYYYYYYT